MFYSMSSQSDSRCTDFNHNLGEFTTEQDHRGAVFAAPSILFQHVKFPFLFPLRRRWVARAAES